MKRHISDVQRCELANMWHDWHRSKNIQACCVEALIDDFGFDPDEAIDALNNHTTVDGFVDEHGIEVHRHGVIDMPWQIDGEAALVVLLAVGGAVLATFCAV